VRAVNLIPADQRGGTRGPVRSQGAAYVVLGLLGALAVLTLLYGIASHQVSGYRAQAASLSAQAQRSEAEAAQLAPYTSFIALREQREQTVLGLVDSRFDWAHALHELGRVLPRDASITTLSGNIGAPVSAGSSGARSAGATTSGTSATPPGSVPTFALNGCAANQTQVALTLDRLRLIDGVSDVTLQRSTKTPKTAGSGGASSGGCAAGAAAFSAQVTFAPIPAPSAVSSAVASGSGPATTSTAGAR
jgi:Tfp pilus assembly protein PilN